MVNHIKYMLQSRINHVNKKKLYNYTPTLISSNCMGGLIYHWLGLQFRSPFINLFLSPNDFVTMLEDFDAFMKYGIREIKDRSYDYPVGEGLHGEIIHFMHYKSFDEAINSWNIRKKRMDINNTGIMLTNLSQIDLEGINLLERFEKLPFKHKVCFVSRPFPSYPHTFYIRGYDTIGNRNLYATQSITGKRYIDQFDYVNFINNLSDGVI